MTEPANASPGLTASTTVELLVLKRELGRWQEILTCQGCRAVVSTVRDLYLQDNMRLCSVCSSGFDAENNSMFYQMNESFVDVQDAAANDPGRIVWILQRLVAAHAKQEKEDEQDNKVDVNDTPVRGPNKAQHEQGETHVPASLTPMHSTSATTPRRSWLPSPSVIDSKPLPWERPGPRKYDSLDPEFLGKSPIAAVGSSVTTGPTFYHYGRNDRKFAYDDGNLREFLKSHRRPHRPADTTALRDLEFEEEDKDPDSQESIIRISTAKGKEDDMLVTSRIAVLPKKDIAEQGQPKASRDDTNQQSKAFDIIHRHIPNEMSKAPDSIGATRPAVHHRSRRRKKSIGPLQSQYRPTKTNEIIRHDPEKESSTKEHRTVCAFTKSLPSHFQSVSSTSDSMKTKLQPGLSVPGCQPSDMEVAMGCQFSQQSESGEEGLTPSLSLPHTSDFENILPNRMRSTEIIRGEDGVVETALTQSLPHTEEFDNIFPGPRPRTSYLPSQDSGSSFTAGHHIAFQEDQGLGSSQSTFYNNGTNTDQSRRPEHPKELVRSVNLPNIEPIFSVHGSRPDIQSKMNTSAADLGGIFPGPREGNSRNWSGRTGERAVTDCEAYSQSGGVNGGIDLFRNLSPLTEHGAVLTTKDQLNSNSGGHYVTPAIDEGIHRDRDAHNNSPASGRTTTNLMIPKRPVCSPIVDVEASTRVMTMLRESSHVVCKFPSLIMKHPFGASIQYPSVNVCRRTFQYLRALVSDICIVGDGGEPIWGDCQLLQDVENVRNAVVSSKEWLREAPWWNSPTQCPCDRDTMKRRRRLLQGYECVVISNDQDYQLPTTSDLDMAKLHGAYEGSLGPIHFRSLTSQQITSLGGAVGMNTVPSFSASCHPDRSIILVPEEIDDKAFREYFQPMLKSRGIATREATSIVYFSWLVDSVAAASLAPMATYAVISW